MKIKEKKNNFKNKGEIKEIKEFPGSLYMTFLSTEPVRKLKDKNKKSSGLK